MMVVVVSSMGPQGLRDPCYGGPFLLLVTALNSVDAVSCRPKGPGSFLRTFRRIRM